MTNYQLLLISRLLLVLLLILVDDFRFSLLRRSGRKTVGDPRDEQPSCPVQAAGLRSKTQLTERRIQERERLRQLFRVRVQASRA